MSACEKCWRDASARSLNTGECLSEVYSNLCAERADNICTPLEQAGKVQCPHCLRVYLYGEFHLCEDTQEGQYD
jgi:hypothetical protein